MRKVLISGGAAREARAWVESLCAAGVDSSVVGDDSFVPLAGDVIVVIRAAAGRSAAPGPGWLGDVPSGSSAPLADYGPGLAHAEWRNDLFNLTSAVEATYIGWTNQAGRPVVGVLRGAVVSPLAASPDTEFNWADCDAGSQHLGEAIIADSMGPAAAFDGPPGDVVERFVKEIIDRLPPDGFELSSADVRGWLRQNLA